MVHGSANKITVSSGDICQGGGRERDKQRKATSKSKNYFSHPRGQWGWWGGKGEVGEGGGGGGGGQGNHHLDV